MKYEPQLAKAGPLVSPSEDWVVERKWDGMRAIFELHEYRTDIFSRTGQDLCPQFPELCNLHERIGVSCILDGEIIALKDGEVEDLEMLQMRLGDKNAKRMDDIPVEVRFFDVLEINGHDLRSQPLRERLLTLADILEDTEFSMPEQLPEGCMVPEHWEGVICKRLDGPYLSGKRIRDWTKWKFVNRTTLWATGLTPGKGAREDFFGAVLVSDQNGVHRGQVGSGFTRADLDAIMAEFATGDPHMLIEVEYRFLSKTGLMVNTAFKGIRYDKDEADAL